MLVKHILQEKGRDILSISAHATLSEAARMLAARRVGAVLVHDGDEELAGIISERDIVSAVAARSVQALADPVSEHMTRRVITCREGDSVEDVMEVMTRRRFRHVPVVEHGRLVGIISIGDVVKTRIAETVIEAETLRTYVMAG